MYTANSTRAKTPPRFTIQISKVENQPNLPCHRLVEELQSLLMQVFRLETQIKCSQGNEQREALRLVNELRVKLQAIEGQLHPQHKKSRSCHSPLSSDRQSPIFSGSSSRARDQEATRIPSVQIQLKHDFPVTNPKEILESIDVKAEDTIKKKQWSHFNLSFSNHPLQDPAFGSFSMIEVKQQQSEFSTSLFNLSNDTSRMVHQGQLSGSGLLVFVRDGSLSKKFYDPIEDVNENPKDFGYELQRMKHESDRGICLYRQSNHLDGMKENLGSFFYLTRKITTVKSFELVTQNIYLKGVRSEKAMRFKKIYSGILCNESLALKHLRIKYYPFIVVGDTCTLECLASCHEDLMIFKDFFLRLIQ